jgi:DNA-binding response OmpR family regulator
VFDYIHKSIDPAEFVERIKKDLQTSANPKLAEEKDKPDA